MHKYIAKIAEIKKVGERRARVSGLTENIPACSNQNSGMRLCYRQRNCKTLFQILLEI